MIPVGDRVCSSYTIQPVTEGIFGGTTPDELHALVQTIAGLKAEATMIHLRCIYDTSKLLDQQQLDVLKQL